MADPPKKKTAAEIEKEKEDAATADAKQKAAAKSTMVRKERPNVSREEPARTAKSSPQYQEQPLAPAPAAGAHAARHLINEDATPGAGALPSYAHASGNEVDGGAG